MHFINCIMERNCQREERDETNSNILPSPSTHALSDQLKPQCLWKCSLSHLRLCWGKAELAGTGDESRAHSTARAGPWLLHPPWHLWDSILCKGTGPAQPLNAKLPYPIFTILSAAQAEFSGFSSPGGHVSLKPQTTVSVPTTLPKYHCAARTHPKRGTSSLPSLPFSC